MIYSKEIQVKEAVDVFVAGGGPAGVVAAVAAARMGRSVYLVEAQGSFGGAATAGLVPSFATFSDGVNLVCDGIGREIREQVSLEFPVTNKWTPIRAEELKRVYDNIVTEAGIHYSFFTTVCDVITDGERMDAVILTSKSGMFAVKASVFIDCTGDGDLCALGGGAFEQGDENGNVMPGTLCSLWANIDYDRRTLGDGAKLEDAFRDGIFTNEDRHLTGMSQTNRACGVGGGNIGHVFDLKPTDTDSLSQAMVWGRKSMLEYERYYKEYLKGFENMMLVSTGAMLGVRESRRIVCDYMLNEQDFLDRAVFDDEIGRYCYPVDIHIMTTDPEEYERFRREYEKLYHYQSGESYGIPYRSLIAKSFTNLLTAGRCIGCDRKMQASVRVIPGCYITGQAAGVAAALTVSAEKQNVRDIDIAVLQKTLAGMGCYLPNRT